MMAGLSLAGEPDWGKLVSGPPSGDISSLAALLASLALSARRVELGFAITTLHREG
jgi:hypothetical protein